MLQWTTCFIWLTLIESDGVFAFCKTRKFNTRKKPIPGTHNDIHCALIAKIIFLNSIFLQSWEILKSGLYIEKNKFHLSKYPLLQSKKLLIIRRAKLWKSKKYCSKVNCINFFVLSLDRQNWVEQNKFEFLSKGITMFESIFTRI